MAHLLEGAAGRLIQEDAGPQRPVEPNEGCRQATVMDGGGDLNPPTATKKTHKNSVDF